ncbi:ankyrin repeat domain-containing protein [Spiroplasma endosymbiont of Asaphidion curtum]|uniref:ankyrin repeat domain-containing protein n=1 Tax=Spiroplasma endosymbiont of Asaphidion curtum TaxID=3066281 RepID=UPI00313BDF24
MLNKKLIEARTTKNTQQFNETSQKIEELKKELNEAMGPIPAINNNNDKKYLDNKIKNLQGEGLKKDEDEIKSINAKVSEKLTPEQKHNLGYTGAYQPQGLNAVNQNITISQKTLKDAIENLADYTYDSTRLEEDIQETKDALVQLLFVTSEAMRFGTYTKYFNHYYKDKDNLTKSSTSKPQTTPPSTGTTDNQVEFKNIPTNVQEILDGKINSLKWKEYEPQLIGGWIAASKNLEQKRKEIFKELRVLLEYFEIHDDFLNNLKEKIKLNQESLFSATDEIFKKIDEKDIPKDIKNEIKNKIKNIWIATILNVLKNSETMPIEIGDQMLKFVLDCMKGWTPVHVAIKTNNLDIAKLLIWRQNELINKPTSSGDAPLHFACSFIEDNKENRRKFLDWAKQRGNNIDVDNIINNQPEINNNYLLVKFLIENGANINARNNDRDTPLHSAARNGNFEIVELLLKHGADVNAITKDGRTPLHYATQEGHIDIVKLLIEHKADVNIPDKNGFTPLHMATIIGHTKIVNLLKEFNRLNELKTKAKTPKKQNEYKDKIKKLLKIELSDVITTLDLGNIEISSGQTQPTEKQIKEKVKQINPQLDISQVKVQENNIKANEAIIEANNENYYPGEVTVTFTLAKKSSNLSAVQDAPGNNDGSAGPKNGNSDATNQGSVGGNIGSDISSNVSVGQQYGTSGTQNQNISGTNHNNRYDVPTDGSCLFWSVATSYLLPVRNDNEEFSNRFIQLFGEENLKYLLHIQKLLQQYNLENNIDLNQLWYRDQTTNNLVRVTFRNRVVDYIRDNLDRQTNLLLENQNQTFRDFINITETNEVDIDNYLIRMRQATTWGGTPEIVAMSNLINNNIRVDNDSPYQPVHQNANNNIQIFHVNGNHYNFALTPEEERANPAIAIDDNQENVPVVDITKRPDNLPTTTPTPEVKPIKLPPVDDHGQYHAILANNNEDDDAHQGNNNSKPKNTTLQKDEYHFFDKKTEDDSLKNDENLEINLIKNNNKIKQNVPVVNKPINKNIINSQISTTTKAINQYNSLSKEEKLKKLNEINRYYQTLSENDKKTFKEKLTNTGLAALSGGALTAYGTKMTVSGTAATSVTNAEAMEMTPLLSTSTTESLATVETITAAALAPETLGLSLVIGGLAIAGTWMYFAFHHHATSNIELPTSIHHNVYDNIEKWYKFLAHDKLKIKINKNTWNEIKQNKNSQANIIKIIKNKFVINDHSGWGGSVTNEDFNTFVKVIVLHFEQINGYFEILDNENDGFVIITNTEGDWLGIE